MKNNIQALRGIAAIMVVLFHVVNGLKVPHEEALIYRFFTFLGQAGVDLFFVISGFVMIYSQARKPRPFRVFLRGRVIRILPMYWFLTLLFVALLLAVPQLFNHEAFDLRKTLASLTLSNWLFTGQLPVVYVGWTLEYEFMFYVILAVSMALLPLQWTPLPVAAVFGLGASAEVLNSAGLEFVFGMLIALARLHYRRLPLAWLVLAAGVAALVATFPFGLPLSRALMWGLPSAIIVLGLLYVPQIGAGLLTYLGSASYSVYLVQVLAIPAAMRLVAKPLHGATFTVQALIVAAISVAAGCIAYQFLETPMTRWLNGTGRGSVARAESTG